MSDIISLWKAVKYPSGTIAVEKVGTDTWIEVHSSENFSANLAHILNGTEKEKFQLSARERWERGIPEVEHI